MNLYNRVTKYFEINIDNYLLGGLSFSTGNRKYEFINGRIESGIHYLHNEDGKIYFSYHEIETFVLVLKLENIYNPRKDFPTKVKEYLDLLKNWSMPIIGVGCRVVAKSKIIL